MRIVGAEHLQLHHLYRTVNFLEVRVILRRCTYDAVYLHPLLPVLTLNDWRNTV